MKLVINIVLFQAAWFTCVLGAAHHRAWLGLVAVALAATWHLVRARLPLRELALLAMAGVIGMIFETLLVQSNLTRFSTGAVTPPLAPWWMVAMWVLFATTLNVALRVLRTRTLLAMALGALGGPLAYYGGEQLGALQFGPREQALLAIGVGWALLTPLLLRAATRLDGYAQP
jgi:hypothetical protein